jgi:hypothetical protein
VPEAAIEARRARAYFHGMYNVVVEWLDEERTRARFQVPGRNEWNAQNVADLIRVLSEIRAQMSPPPEQVPILLEAQIEERWSVRR